MDDCRFPYLARFLEKNAQACKDPETEVSSVLSGPWGDLFPPQIPLQPSADSINCEFLPETKNKRRGPTDNTSKKDNLLTISISSTHSSEESLERAVCPNARDRGLYYPAGLRYRGDKTDTTRSLKVSPVLANHVEGSLKEELTYLPEHSVLSVCRTCQHFLPSHLNPRQGFGRCKIAENSGRPGAYPGKPACKCFVKKLGQPVG